MSRIQLVLVALAAMGLAAFAGVPPAAARDYPWCAQGGEYDYPGECAYSTYEQCQASVSGRLLFCDRNPRFAYGPDRPPQPPPHRRARAVAPY
ncbi:DUF3551 domain-containing protein [Bradyrhizobium sp. DOA1]|uniref:DUF3551 domain-containing protein n=1 Tax=Bradyrhizobium sp. DOA1 TaxID=1126616 RepID=UPI00077C81D7|nr:DUF3551 domain-containing protein [Bradyrhizobium sp. DOA1]KYH02907.1 hypothetical protein SE91_34550 [Bradyrhizobium sp. DOA1]